MKHQILSLTCLPIPPYPHGWDKDTNKPREKSKLACIFSEAEYLRRSQSTNKPREKSKFACIFFRAKVSKTLRWKRNGRERPRAVRQKVRDILKVPLRHRPRSVRQGPLPDKGRIPVSSVETGRERQQLIRQGFGHTLVTRGVGMQTVGLPVAEITDMRIGDGIKTADAVEVDHRNRPDAPGLADFGDIGVGIEPQPVGVRFVGLDVPVAETRITAVKRREQDDLLGRIVLFEKGQHGVDPSAEGPGVRRRRAAHPRPHGGTRHRALRLPDLVPLAQRHAGIEIVGPGKDDDGIHGVAPLGIQLPGLPQHIGPLVSVDSVDERHDAQHLGQILPVVFRRADMAFVRDRIAEKGDPLFEKLQSIIDNDLVLTDHTPGYGSAAKYVASTVREIAIDASVYDNKPSVTIVEIMGRHAGWLTAASVLARKFEQDNPVLIYLPEADFDQESFLASLEEYFKTKNNLIVCVSEGIHDKDGTFICEYAASAGVDAFGHKMLTGCGKYLENLVRDRLGVKVRSVELNVNQRCSAFLQSETDALEAAQAGAFGVTSAISGETGKMVSFVRKSDKPYVMECGLEDVNLICNQEKTVPVEWITKDGTDIAQAFIDYALPLIQGSPKLPMKDGLAVYAYRKPEK